MHYYKILLTIVFILSWIFVQSQERCATVPYNAQLNEQFSGQYEIPKFEEWIRERIRNKQFQAQILGTQEEPIYRIPVVVHVIHNGEQEGQDSNISNEQILSQISVLNTDYRRLNGDTINTPPIFQPVAADTYIEFKLAERDPNGQETNGIVRVMGTQTEWLATDVSDNAELKSLSFWPPEDYLNIWVTTLANDYLGYAQYPITSLPGSIPPFDRETDGVVIHYRAFGSKAYGAFNLFNNYDRGRTTSHEIGHYFGLRHIWGDVIGCDGTDYCDDTPQAYESHTSCINIDPISCGSEDMYQNYLDYSYDRCMNLFTQDQVIRMRTVIENSPRRVSLLTSPGLLPPQNEYNFIVVRDILSPADIGCDDSFQPLLSVQNNGINDITSYTISLTIDVSSYDITFNGDTVQPGEVRILDLSQQTGSTTLPDGQYYMKAGIRNPNGIDTVDLSDYDIEKYFLTSTDADIAPSIEKFESTDFDLIPWSVYNPDNDLTWMISDIPSELSTNRAAGMNMYDYFQVGAKDWLISPVLDLRDNIDANVTFDFSYARGHGAEDILDLKVSTDCGKTWPFTIFSASGDQLVTGSTGGPWLPDGPADWKRGFADLKQFAGSDSIRLAFVTTNLNGNNLYLDNIETFITGFTQDITLDENSMLIHPNPSRGDRVYITLKTDGRQDVDIVIVNMNGKIIYDMKLKDVLNQTYEIDLVGRNTGVYIVKVIGTTYHQTSRLVLTR